MKGKTEKVFTSNIRAWKQLEGGNHKQEGGLFVTDLDSRSLQSGRGPNDRLRSRVYSKRKPLVVEMQTFQWENRQMDVDGETALLVGLATKPD